MGYSATTIIVYGVRISHDEAKELCSTIPGLEEGVNIGGIEAPENGLWQRNDAKFALRYGQRQIFNVELLSEGTDSRVHSLHLENDDEQPESYCFGVYCGSKGYAYMDNIEKVLQNPVPQEAIDAWNAHCGFYVKEQPSFLICNQTW